MAAVHATRPLPPVRARTAEAAEGRAGRLAHRLNASTAEEEGLIGPAAHRLARAARAGLPVPIGQVFTTAFAARVHAVGVPAAGYAIPDPRVAPGTGDPTLRALTSAWHEVALGGLLEVTLRPLGDDADGADGAEGPGQPVPHWSDLLETVARLVRGPEPVPILLQRATEASHRGTAARLGSGRRGAVAVTTVGSDGPRSLLVRPRRGDRVTHLDAPPPGAPGDAELHAIARLARNVDGLFGEPHPIRWAVDASTAGVVLLGVGSPA